MGFADCTACLHWHRRPVNSKCEYAKIAVAKCAMLGLYSAEYLLYLQDLLPEDTDSARSEHGGRQVKLA